MSMGRMMRALLRERKYVDTPGITQALDVMKEVRRRSRNLISGHGRHSGDGYDNVTRHSSAGREVHSRLKCNTRSCSQSTAAGVLKPRHLRGMWL